MEDPPPDRAEDPLPEEQRQPDGEQEPRGNRHADGDPDIDGDPLDLVDHLAELGLPQLDVRTDEALQRVLRRPELPEEARRILRRDARNRSRHRARAEADPGWGVRSPAARPVGWAPCVDLGDRPMIPAPVRPSGRMPSDRADRPRRRSRTPAGTPDSRDRASCRSPSATAGARARPTDRQARLARAGR